MTYIQPKKSYSLINILLAAAVLGVLGGAAGLIMIYNQTVALSHGIQISKNELRAIETANAEMKGKIFSLFDPESVTAFASGRGLIIDKNPQYIEVSKQWVVASYR
ncbi:MAG: hypothetical protein AAB495_02110 [Patescibacteria group bacterium]